MDHAGLAVEHPMGIPGDDLRIVLWENTCARGLNTVERACYLSD